MLRLLYLRGTLVQTGYGTRVELRFAYRRPRWALQRWVGFLTLLYFCIGISELVINPNLRLYGLVTTVASVTMFLASIYYARFLGYRELQQNGDETS